MLRAKAVLCAGLTVRLTDEASGEKDEWHYENGLRDYLRSMLGDNDYLPPSFIWAHWNATTRRSISRWRGCRKASSPRKATST